MSQLALTADGIRYEPADPGWLRALEGERRLWEVEIFPQGEITWLALSPEGTVLVGEEDRRLHEVCPREGRVLRTYGQKSLERRSPEAVSAGVLAELAPEEREALRLAFARLAEDPGALPRVLDALVPLAQADKTVERAWRSGAEVQARLEAGEDLTEWLASWRLRLERQILWALG